VSHGINVGLFAEEANAIKVHAQLTEAGLPVTMQTVEGTRGPRTRVRAGPFPDRASADAAAQRIRAMGLEAQIYRQ
jgi:cell division septation protein DedD